MIITNNTIENIRLAGVIEESFTDGVGIRYVVFTQGCKHHCYKCQNPETWSFTGGYDKNINELVNEIIENPMLDGVTLSGGDPMYQPDAVVELIRQLRDKSNLNIWVYTGFKYEECVKDTKKLEILKNIDILVDGEYQDENRSLQLRFRGSSNQRIIDVKKSLANKEIVLHITD